MHRPAIAWLLSFAAVAAAVLLRWALDPVIGDSLPLVTLFGAVAVAVWVGGYRPAIAVTLVGYLACDLLFIEPRGVLGLDRLGNIVGLLAYCFTCALIIGLGEAMRFARSRAAEDRDLLQITLRSIGDAVITTGADGRLTYLNDVAVALTGWTLEEARGHPLEKVFRIVSESTRQLVESPAVRALRDGVVVGLANHTQLIRKDGTECPIDDSAAPIRDAAGKVSGCVLIFRDVTAQRRLERERASRLTAARLLAAIVESSDDAIISKSLDGTIQAWNAAAERLFGHRAEDAVGRHISLVIPPERIAEEERIISSLQSGLRIEHFETERLRADGRRIVVSLTISPVRDEDGKIVGASKIVRDMTEKKRVEADRDRFAAVIESSTDFIAIFDTEGVPFFVNRAGLEMVGLESIDEARTKPVREFFFPEDQPRVFDEFVPSVLAKGHGEIEVRFRNFRTGAARWMVYKVLTLPDASGKPVALATVSQDITERKQMEDNLRQLASDLSLADRRKDEFLATLAHELRNPLAPLSNMLEVMKRAAGNPETLHRARDTMGRQLGQLVRLVDDLLDVNRITHDRLELRRSEVELAPIVRQAIEASRPLIDAGGHELVVTLPSAPIFLNCDPARLAQVFGNLLTNSAKYTPAGGRIDVTVTRESDDAMISVRDNGSGIPPDKLERIFDMFMQVDRSLEHAQGGLGIGLTLVRRLVEMHGGSVAARSAGEGLGSEFVVQLPVLRAEQRVVPPTLPGPATPATGRCILIVDDNEDSAESLAMLLQITGHQTHMAHDGVEAIAAAERHRPEVMLLDIGLPNMNGHDVCREIRVQPWGAAMTIIALTGWGQDDDRRRSQEAGFDGHLVKPVDYDALMALLGPR